MHLLNILITEVILVIQLSVRFMFNIYKALYLKNTDTIFNILSVEKAHKSVV